MYYLITYVWERDYRDIISMDLWAGTIGEWMIDAVQQKEHWRLINAFEISENEYNILKDYIG